MDREALRATIARLVPGSGPGASGVDVAVAEMLSHYLGDEPFGGRGEALATLDTWLADMQGPRCALLSAPAGRGKSALLLRWATKLLGRPGLAVVYYPISVRHGTNRASSVFAGLAARLAALHGEPEPGSAHREQAAAVRELLARALPDGRALVVIVDGYDEGVGWEPGVSLLPDEPPEGVHILVAARTRAGDVADRGWLGELGWRSARRLTLAGLGRAGVLELARQAGAALAGDRLYALSEGDPLLVSLYVQALRPHAGQAALLQAEDLAALQPGLEAMLTACFDRWRAEQDLLWGEGLGRGEIDALLAICAVACGPLAAADVLAIGGAELGGREGLARALGLLGRFILGDGEVQGLTFSHPRLREYFAQRLGEAGRAFWQARFLAYGRAVVRALTAGSLAPAAVPAYVLQYHSAHLLAAGAATEDYAALLCEGWLRAWEALEDTPVGFLHDAQLAWQRARADGVEGLAVQWRAVLAFGSVVSVAVGVPDYLLIPCVEAGLVSTRLALVMTRRQHREAGRARCLVELCAFLPAAERPAVLAEALALMRGLPDPFERAYALGFISGKLPPEERPGVLAEMLAAVRAIAKDSAREGPLDELAELLGEADGELRAQVLEVARGFSEPQVRAQALARMLVALVPAPERSPALLAELAGDMYACAGQDGWDADWEAVRACIPAEVPGLLAAALERSCGLEDEEARSAALVVVIGLLPAHAPELLPRAWAVVRELADPAARFDALTAMVPVVTEREALAGEALAAARAIADAKERACALAVVVGRFLVTPDPSVFAEACAAALEISGEDDPAYALRDIIEQVAPLGRTDFAEELLRLARALVDGEARARTLIAAARCFAEGRRAEIYAEARAGLRALPWPQDVAYGLLGLAGALGPEERREALAEALAVSAGIEPPGHRAYFLNELATRASELSGCEDIPGRILHGALAEFTDGKVGSWPFSDLADMLGPGDRARALGTALAIDRMIRDHGGQARVLAAISSHLPQDERREVLALALQCLAVSERDDDAALAAVALQAPEAGDLQAELLALARRRAEPGRRAEALLIVAPTLAAAQREAALAEAVEAVEQASDPLAALRRLLEVVSDGDPLLARALQIARRVNDPSERAWCLEAVACGVAGPGRLAVLDEGLAAARAIHVAPGWSPAAKLGMERRLLAARIPLLVGEARRCAAEDLRVRVRAADSSTDCERELVALAGMLDGDEEQEARRGLLREALALALTHAPEWQGEALARVAGGLAASDGDILEGVQIAARALAEGPHRAEAASRLAVAVQATFPANAVALAGEALAVCEGLGPGRGTLPIVQRVLPFWDAICAARGIHEFDALALALGCCARAERGEAFGLIEAALPVLARLGGAGVLRGVTRAILDVCRWWP